MRLLLPAILAVTALYLSAATAGAQPLGPRAAPFQSGPTVSPYLNLLRGQGLPAVNYYGIVRPQFDTNARFRALGQTGLQSAATPAEPDGQFIPTTGLSAGFMNHGSFFMTTGGGGTARPSRGPVGGAFGMAPTGSAAGISAPARAPRAAFR